MLRAYYRLAKPGIVYGNLLTTIAAYLYAAEWHVGLNFLAVIAGLGLVIASACVCNNYIDSDIDKKMERTSKRALASGAISPKAALVFAAVLGALGFALLFLFVNTLTALVALAGFLVYVFAYSFSKRTTEWATEIGSIAGAAPIVVGYTTVTDRLDAVVLILFFILALWQMPHFYAIAMRRSSDYAAAGIPVLPLKRGVKATKMRTFLYVALFLIAALALTAADYAGYVYAAALFVIGIAWLWRAAQGFYTDDDVQWATRLFFFSLIVLLVFCAALSVATILP